MKDLISNLWTPQSVKKWHNKQNKYLKSHQKDVKINLRLNYQLIQLFQKQKIKKTSNKKIKNSKDHKLCFNSKE